MTNRQITTFALAVWALGFLCGIMGHAIYISSEERLNKASEIASVDLLDSITPIDTFQYKPIEGLPRNFDTVPGGNNVFRTSQPSLEQMETILNEYPIDVVIRMNGEEGTGVLPDDERETIESMGKKYIWINAHLGYEKGRGYTKSIDTVQYWMNKGSVLIHCTAGKDRTGYQVAYYMKNTLKWNEKDLWEYTIKYNDWEKFICEGRSGYIKYMEAFYPYEKWLNNKHCK
jgi:hypothetical protein